MKFCDIKDKEERRKAVNKYFGQHNCIGKMKNDMTISSLSEHADIDQGSLSNMLNGKKNVYLHVLIDIAEALNCTVGDLLPTSWLAESSVKPITSRNLGEYDRMHMKRIIKDVESIIKTSRKEVTEDIKADLIIALFEETHGLAENEIKSRLEYLINFFIKARTPIEKAL